MAWDTLVDLLLLVDAELSGAAVDKQQQATHDGQDLEEIVLGKVLVGVVFVELSKMSAFVTKIVARCSTYSPEVVDKDVEDTQDEDQKSGAELGLESNHNHDTSKQANERDNDSPERPVTAPDKADEQEDEQNTASKLEIHLAVLLVDRGEAGESLGLPDPRVGENHQKATNDGQVSEEKVEVKDETVSEGLHDHDAHESGNRIVGISASDDEERAGYHGEDVGQEENVVETGRDCC